MSTLAVTVVWKARMLLPTHIEALEGKVKYLGKTRLCRLAHDFPSADALDVATEDALRNSVRHSGAAEGLKRYLDGDRIERIVVIAGTRYVSVWDPTTAKVIRGLVAPPEGKVDEYLRDNPGLELYTGQDRVERSRAVVPGAIRMRDEEVVEPDEEVFELDEEVVELGAPGSAVQPFKEKLSVALDSLHKCLEEIKQGVQDQTAIDAVQSSASELSARAKSSRGYEMVFVGGNGIGKTTLANAVLFNSSEGGEAYLSRLPGYLLESLLDSQTDSPLTFAPTGAEQQQSEAAEVPTFERLHSDVQLRAKWVVERLEAPTTTNVALAKELAKTRAQQLREREGNPFISYALPCGNETGTTTAVTTSIRYGQVVQMSVRLRTLDELREQAFVFVQLHCAREPGCEDTEFADELRIAYAAFKMICTGEFADIYDIENDGYPDKVVPSLPTSRADVVVCRELTELVEHSCRTFVGDGASLDLDLQLMHDKLSELMDSRSVKPLAVRRVVIYLPCTVLKGGNALGDVPGFNTASLTEQMQTASAVTASTTGALVVMLRKDLDGDQTAKDKLLDFGIVKQVLLGRMRVHFVFNREHSGQKLIPSQLAEAKEAYICEALVRNTRISWKKLLVVQNNRLPKEQALPDAEIEKIALATTLLPVYPMLHTCAALNRRERPKEARAADEHSGMLTLFGLFEELNQGLLLDATAQLCTDSLPRLCVHLQSTLSDSGIKIPPEIVHVARNMLRHGEALRNAREAVGKEVDTLFKKVCDDMYDTVSRFFYADPPISANLKARRSEQARSFEQFKRACNMPYKVVQALQPRHNGLYRGLQILPIAFPSDYALCDCEALCEQIDEHRPELYEGVLRIVFEKVSELMANAHKPGESKLLLQQLLQTVYEHKIDQPLKDRNEDFYRAYQKKSIELTECRTGDYLAKLISRERGPALQKVLLSPHCSTQSPREAFRHIEASCVKPTVDLADYAAAAAEKPAGGSVVAATSRLVTEAESQWIVQSEGKVKRFVYDQMVRFCRDLTGYKVRGPGLLHGMLTSFFSHVVDAAALAGDDVGRTLLTERMRELKGRAKALRALHSQGVGTAQNAAKLGSAISSAFAEMLEREESLCAVRDAGLKCQPALECRMLPSPPEAPLPFEPFRQKEHQFAEGDRNQLAVCLTLLARDFHIEPILTATGDRLETPSLFEAVARSVYKSPSTFAKYPARADSGSVGSAESGLAQNLRAICCVQMSHHYRKPERSAKLAVLVGEPSESYLRRLRVGDAAGDMLCLYHLGHYLKVRFRVLRPGVALLPIMIPQPTVLTEFEASEAYNLVVIGASEQRAPPAAFYSPCFVPTRPIGMPDASSSRNEKRRADAEPEVEASSSDGGGVPRAGRRRTD